ncbi:hypothetical protein [Brevibacillus sp. H7]|uniref:hypothetical protein n=1 Tax=Brevibacillus sp. H7 TaxID=3349138 RepID=UPI00382D1D93
MMRAKSLRLIGVVALALLWGHPGGTVLASEQSEAPQRVHAAPFPAQIAFTNNHHLWIVDGRKPHAAPRQLTRQGSVEIVGWSHDGEWLLYLHHSTVEAYQSPGYLWAVKADGTGAFQVDSRPIQDLPVWSPNTLQVAYRVQGEGPADAAKYTFRVVEIAPGKATEVLTISNEPIGFSWMPDGKSLLISTPAARNRPMRLEQVDLEGKRLAAYPLGDPPKVEEGIYGWAADGLKLSPDGRYVAYYVLTNAASLNADGVAIQLFKLDPAAKPIDIGVGLAYPEWLAWSPDSRQLAYISGGGREAMANKQLKVAVIEGKVTAIGQPGMVDSLPIWQSENALYFARGTATEYNYQPQKPMVPGQRIWMRTSEREQVVTEGSSQTADTYPNPSPDGKALLFLRLDRAEHGSLFVKTTQAGEEAEVLCHVTGGIGYYGNYLPAWIQVYWTR